MKTKFTLSPIIEVALPKAVKQDKLSQAVEAYLNGMKTVEETAKRGGLKEVKKSADSRVTESLTTVYAGERNIVSNFIQWHDRVVSLANRAEKFGCVVTCAEIPPIYSDWLAKFTDKAAKAEAGQVERTGKTPKSENGPASRIGGLVPS